MLNTDLHLITQTRNRKLTLCGLMSCQDKALALLAPLARGGDMLGRADAGYNLLIGNPIYSTYF